MWPTCEQIQTSAYHRWRRRGGRHGFDREDWLAAEEDLLFRLNYRVVARHRLDERDGTRPGSTARRRCRFCERAEPSARFHGSRPGAGELGGASRLLDRVECAECIEDGREPLEAEFARFSRPFRSVARVRGLAGWPSYRWAARWAAEPDRGAEILRLDRPDGSRALWYGSEPYVPLAACKYLARLALAVVPAEMLEEFGGTLEWVSNPDHGLDHGAFVGLTCRVYLVPNRFAGPWVSLAQRTDDDAPVPSTLFFLGAGHAVFQVAVPLGSRDDDLDGERLRIPVAAMPGDCEVAPWESPWLDVPLDVVETRHGAALELSYCGEAARALESTAASRASAQASVSV
jgi:hypothetical protein